MSKSILSFFKKSTDSESSIESTVEPVNNVNSVDNEAPVNSVDTVHDDLASGSRPVHSENSGPSCHISQYRLDRIFQFPKSIRGKRGKTDSADLFFETVLKKSSTHDFINDPVLPRKRKKNPNYRSLNEYFTVEGHSNTSQVHHSLSPKEHFRIIYIEV